MIVRQDLAGDGKAVRALPARVEQIVTQRGKSTTSEINGKAKEELAGLLVVDPRRQTRHRHDETVRRGEQVSPRAYLGHPPLAFPVVLPEQAPGLGIQAVDITVVAPGVHAPVRDRRRKADRTAGHERPEHLA